MRHRLKKKTQLLDGRDISGGVSRNQFTYETQPAITRHGKLLENIKLQRITRLGGFALASIAQLSLDSIVNV